MDLLKRINTAINPASALKVDQKIRRFDLAMVSNKLEAAQLLAVVAFYFEFRCTKNLVIYL